MTVPLGSVMTLTVVAGVSPTPPEPGPSLRAPPGAGVRPLVDVTFTTVMPPGGAPRTCTAGCGGGGADTEAVLVSKFSVDEDVERWSRMGLGGAHGNSVEVVVVVVTLSVPGR